MLKFTDEELKKRLGKPCVMCGDPVSVSTISHRCCDPVCLICAAAALGDENE